MSSGLMSSAQICSLRYFLSQCPFYTPPILGTARSYGLIAWQWLMCANCHWESFYIKHQCSALLWKVTSAFLSLPSHLVCRSIVEYTVWVCKAETALVLGCPWDCSSQRGGIRQRGNVDFFFCNVHLLAVTFTQYIVQGSFGLYVQLMRRVVY